MFWEAVLRVSGTELKMEKEQIEFLVKKQKEFFKTGTTLNVNFRIENLKKLREAIKRREKDIANALYEDLGKSDYESYMCEIGMALSEISYLIKNTKKLSREKKVKTPLAQFASKSYKKPSPYGNTLIMSPWNYPFLLTIDPLADAIAAGNTAVVKPSAYSPSTSKIVEEIIGECFLPEYVCAVTGGRRENSCLLAQKFDFIFFTGSTGVGKEVLMHAAEHLTPVVLELGGKSPCIVDESADIKLSARRIVFGKYLNCGQTCVAPDYILCHHSIKDEFINAVKEEIVKQYGDNSLENENYGHIVNKKHFDRILGLIEQKKVVFGGEYDEKRLKLSPTVMDNVTWEDRVMGEEIFGPIMPVLTYEKAEEICDILFDKPKPLALYLFSNDKNTVKKITERVSFGGGCINDTVIHLATTEMGFGGVGESGMGSYHGKEGFFAFSHTKSIVNKKNWIDLPMRYQPYKGGFSSKLLRMFLK